MTDKFTERLLAEDQLRKERPELFQLTKICRECGKRETLILSRQLVFEYAASHNGSRDILGYCKQHDDDSEEDED